MNEFILSINKLAKGTTGNRLGFFFHIADSNSNRNVDKAELMVSYE